MNLQKWKPRMHQYAYIIESLERISLHTKRCSFHVQGRYEGVIILQIVYEKITTALYLQPT